MEEIKRYYDLRKEIERYDDFYYNKNKSLISDYEYDILRKELEAIENKYPHLGNYGRDNVGAKLSLNRFPKVKHQYRMTSLQNTYDFNELANWMNKMKNASLDIPQSNEWNLVDFIHGEWKFDGLSISLKYNTDGILTQALTRGDGEYGEDVTENAYEIDSIPKKITIDNTNPLYPYLIDTLNKDGFIEMRGEVLMSFEEFNRINAIRKNQGEELYANPRNLASGTLRNLDKSIFADRKLLFAPYHLENVLYMCDYKNFLLGIRKMGFKPFDNLTLVYAYKSNPYDPNELYSSLMLLLEALGQKDRMWYNGITIPIDGLVFKVNRPLYNALGLASDRYPRGGVAYKFSPNVYQTKLLDITYQIGRTGKITPVAELVNVLIDGSNISRCTLHNFDEISRLNLRKNCYVHIVKSAAVIPKIIGRDTQIRPDEIPIEIPIRCPICGGVLTKKKSVDGGENVDLYCPNPLCRERVKQQVLYHFNTLQVKGFGPALYNAFVTVYEGYNNTPFKGLPDIYRMIYERPIHMKAIREMAGCKVVQNFLDSLEICLKSAPFWRQLASLGIEGIGSQTAKDIESKCSSYDDFINNYPSLGLSMDVVNYIKENISNDYTIFKYIPEILEVISKYGFTLQRKGDMKSDAKYSAVITGSFDFATRDEITKFLEEFDVKLVSTVSKNTNFVIVGKNPGSKYDKAKELGIPIMQVSSFDELSKEIESYMY